MKMHKVNKLKLGVYRFHWKSGGTSVAVVGHLHDGERWFACSNWTAENPTNEDVTGLVMYGSKWWSEVRKVELITVK